MRERPKRKSSDASRSAPSLMNDNHCRVNAVECADAKNCALDGCVADVMKDAILSARSVEDQARLKFLGKLTYKGVWAPRVQQLPSYQTLIIFDWDDTLLCTSYLTRFAAFGLLDLSKQVRNTLKIVEKNVLELLELAIACGQTFIITNAQSGWVESSAKLWAPSLVNVLRNVQVVSARSRYEEQFPDDATRWKCEAFLDVSRHLDNQVITNLVSLGDSEHEMKATQIMGNKFQRASVKFVKFTPLPSPKEMQQQLTLVYQAFTDILGKGSNLSIRLTREP